MRQVTEKWPQSPPYSHFEKLIEDDQAKQQREIAASRRFPYKPVAYLIGWTYCIAVVCWSCAVRLLHGVRSHEIHRRLAEAYYYVPEMALHKSIELKSFLREKYKGKGLDLGCGNGMVGGILRDLGGLCELYGIDLNEGNRGLALGNGYAGFAPGDIQSLAYPRDYFDYAISVCVIEHVPDLTCAVENINRVLKPGGRFMFSTTAPLFRESTLGYRFFKILGLHHEAEGFMRHKDVQSMQYHYLSPKEWHEKLAKAGFNDIKVHGIFSRRQLLIYDLLNFQVNCLRLYFADKLYAGLTKLFFLRKLMIGATEVLSAHFSTEDVTEDTATHYFVTCVKKNVLE